MQISSGRLSMSYLILSKPFPSLDTGCSSYVNTLLCDCVPEILLALATTKIGCGETLQQGHGESEQEPGDDRGSWGTNR